MSIAQKINELIASGSRRQLLAGLIRYKDAAAEEKVEIARLIEQARVAGKLSAQDTVTCLQFLQHGDQTILLTEKIATETGADATAQLPKDGAIEHQKTLIRTQRIEDETARIHAKVGFATADATLAHAIASDVERASIDAPLATRPEPFPATLAARDKTQVLSDRLVRSLDDVEETRLGPVEPGTVIKKRFLLERIL